MKVCSRFLFPTLTQSPKRLLYITEALPQTEEEKEIHANVSAVLNKGPDILEKLSTYVGCEELIRKVFFVQNFFKFKLYY